MALTVIDHGNSMIPRIGAPPLGFGVTYPRDPSLQIMVRLGLKMSPTLGYWDPYRVSEEVGNGSQSSCNVRQNDPDVPFPTPQFHGEGRGILIVMPLEHASQGRSRGGSLSMSFV